MGCAVNGPGEAREADIGITAGRKQGLLFAGARLSARCLKINLWKHFKKS